MPKRFAFVGCYTGFTKGQLGWVGTPNAGTGITTLEFDEVTGRLENSKHPVMPQDSPTWLEVCLWERGKGTGSNLHPTHLHFAAHILRGWFSQDWVLFHRWNHTVQYNISRLPTPSPASPGTAVPGSEWRWWWRWWCWSRRWCLFGAGGMPTATRARIPDLPLETNFSYDTRGKSCGNVDERLTLTA